MSAEEVTPPQGAVELREDAPLKAAMLRSGERGARYIGGAFAALTLAITGALLTQLYSGHVQVVPHGAVSAGGEHCSAVGVRAMRAGGGAVDAAVAAALCVRLTGEGNGKHPRGALLLWRYRSARTEPPTLAEWDDSLVAALVDVHARFGTMPWGVLLARVMSETDAWTGEKARASGDLHERLLALRNDTGRASPELWRTDGVVKYSSVQGAAVAGGWRLYAPGGGRATLAAAMDALRDVDEEHFAASVSQIVRDAQQSEMATGVAVIDTNDVYVSLVIGGRGGTVTPAILVEEDVCGRRFVVGAGEAGTTPLALMQVLARLPRATLRDAVESYRLLACCDPRPLLEGNDWRPASGVNVNVVAQTGDRLQAHADSRALGVAARF